MKCFSLKIIFSFKLKQHEINKTIKELKQTKIAKKTSPEIPKELCKKIFVFYHFEKSEVAQYQLFLSYRFKG